MRAWLLSLLGGIDALVAEKQLYDAVTRTQADVQFYRDELNLKDLEIQRLTNLMLAKTGFIIPEGKTQERKEFQPINHRKPWSERQRELELKDANEQAERLKKQWEAKNNANKVSEAI